MKIITTKYVCDRCRKEFEEPSKIAFTIGYKDRDGTFHEKDVCPTCSNLLIKFMCEVE